MSDIEDDVRDFNEVWRPWGASVGASVAAPFTVPGARAIEIRGEGAGEKTDLEMIALAGRVETAIGGRLYERGNDFPLGKATWLHIALENRDPTPVSMTFTAIGPADEARYGAGVTLTIAPDLLLALTKNVELPVPGGDVCLFLDEAAKLHLHTQLEQNITIIRNRRLMAAVTRADAWPRALRPIVLWWLTRNLRG